MAEHGAISNVYFGFSPMWVATCILLVTYAVIISEKINRSIVALIGGGAMVLVGVINQEEALKGVDWNTIGLLTGMMILVSISRRSGMFQYLAIWSARAARAHPARAVGVRRPAGDRAGYARNHARVGCAALPVSIR